MLHQKAWDLLALVVVGGAVASAYQAWARVLTRRWAIVILLSAVAAAVVALALAVP